MKLLTFLFLFTLAATAQQANLAAKPEGAKVAPTIAAPKIQTSTLWRLLAESQQSQMQLEAATKTAKDAQEALTAEQQKLSAQCGDGFMLAIDTDPKSASYKDAVCQLKPPAEKPKEK